MTNPISEVDKSLNQRLCGVMQSIDTNGFFNIVDANGTRENEASLKKR